MRTARALAAASLVAIAGYGCEQVTGLHPPDTTPSKQHCVDGKKDADETDIDCGGADCLACAGAACTMDAQCQSDGCMGGQCVKPSCTDGVFDGYESSLDCGDPRGAMVGCQLCANDLHCYNGCNCTSGFCDPTTNTCAEAQTAPNCDHCTDGVEDFDETGVDCGGAKCPACM